MQLIMHGKYHFRQSGRQFGHKFLCPPNPPPPPSQMKKSSYATGGALPPLTAPLTKIMLRNTFSLVALEDFFYNSEAKCIMLENYFSLSMGGKCWEKNLKTH